MRPNLNLPSDQTHTLLFHKQHLEEQKHTHSTQPRTRAGQETHNEKYVNPKTEPETTTQQEGTTSADKQSCRPTLG